jgi:predicted RNA-binding Zn-ribbon protein involved in translation (DUF1610 family)
MRGNVKLTSRWCKSCKKQVAAQADSAVWGCGDLIMVLLTFGLWAIFRLVMLAIFSPYRCTNCGRRV